jgi:hypothetical protein
MMAQKMKKTFSIIACSVLSVARAADSLSTYDKEQLQLQQDLSWLTVAMWGMVIGLICFAFAIRFIARRTTKPCHWCMEFIRKSETTCPRCGKNLVP